MTAIIEKASPSKFTANALSILKKRYLEPDESVDHMFHRVADGNEHFIRIMQNLDFLPNSPTLMNAGTSNEGKSTFSACFKFDVADSMLEGPDSIIETIRKAAGVAKWGGGVGYYLGDLRAKGTSIRSVHRVACGPINVLHHYNSIGTHLITQGGRRELAQMAILPCDHADIREFIHVKDENPQALRTFNISVAASNDFMRQATGETISPSAYKLWHEIIEAAWLTGDPGLYFPDIAELFNPTPHLGKLTGTNPCGEVPLLNNEACNLGSINLANFVTSSRTVDWNRLEETVRYATLFLDNILDRNCFPHPAITEMVAKTRKLGLGVMGWADMLALMHIHYDSEAALTLAYTLMKFINDIARDTSHQLSKKNGPYPGYADYGMEVRNSTRTCIAPTGTISILAGASSGVEPHYALAWDRILNAGVADKEETIGEHIQVEDRLEGFEPHIANEIDWQWHVRMQAAFQKNTDLAVSKTINLKHTATREDIAGAYKMMWELKCKGGTIFRDGCRKGGEQVLTAKTVGKSTHVAQNGHNGNGNGHITNRLVDFDWQKELTHGPIVPDSSDDEVLGHEAGLARIALPGFGIRRKPPKERKSIAYQITIGSFDAYLHAGMYDDGSLCEIFFRACKEGSTVGGLLDSWAIAVSHALQYGDPLDSLVRKYSGMRFEPSGFTGDPLIPTCTSIVDYVMRWLDKKFGKGRDDPEHKGECVNSGMICPDCHGPAIYQSGCLTCKTKCGWSRCG